MTILVTGGSGFIGAHVVRRLADEGHAVRCLLRPASRTRRIDGLPWERVEGDVRDGASVARAAAGCGAVVHLASPSGWDAIDGPGLEETIVGGTENVLLAARAGGARVVFVSSVAAVNGSDRPEVFHEGSPCTLTDPALRYARAKQAAEERCRAAAAGGVDAVIVNPAEVYGPGDDDLVTAGNLRDLLSGPAALVCAGGTSVVHVEDVAAGIVAALHRGQAGERYILAGENLTLATLARLARRLGRRRGPVLCVPRPLLRALARAAAATGAPLPFNPKVLPYATRYWFVTADKSRRDLGVSFRGASDTLAPAVEWLRAAGHVA